MKLIIATGKKGVRRLNIVYDGLQSRIRQKSFPIDGYEALLNFAMGLNDRYVLSCDDEIYRWIESQNHPILKAKNWCFA